MQRTLQQDNILDMAVIAALAGQPQVDPTLIYLCAYDADGLKLDLYGEILEDGYNVVDACLSGTKVSLDPLLNHKLLIDLSGFCDRRLPDAAARAESDRADAQTMQRPEWLGVGA